MKYNPETNRITMVDNGGVEVLRGVPYGGMPEEVIKNGFLFAAAPEMYEALNAIVHGYFIPPYKQVLAVLKKARGEG